MTTNLNVRKPHILTLAVLAFLLAAAVLLGSLAHTTSLNSSVTGAALSAASPGGGEVIMPRVRFAPLEGHRYPVALEGKKIPPAALDGKKLPPSALDGKKIPPAALDGKKIPPAALGGKRIPPAAQANPSALQSAPLTLVDGLILLALGALLLAPARKTKPTLR